IIGVTGGDGEDDDINGSHSGKGYDGSQLSFDMTELEQWKNNIYAKIVKKCGSRQYWETWAKDIAEIAARHIAEIKVLIAQPEIAPKFDEFLAGLRGSLNPSIDKDDAIEMLAEHLITKPVFDALFDNYSFLQSNPVSRIMQNMLDVLHDNALEKEQETLDKFYASVQERAKGIDNAEGKQKIIIELYEQFFKNALPKETERLGIVYTPVEVVDFIIQSVEYVMQQRFGRSISDKGVHVLDPFTGTGTFIVSLLR
ncbi:N-6 DNA methylase, partial [Faecalibacterium prausnitzii]|uniref:N-6 DNA methylase n=1 Tax=Faecalibacterium prausnitzii TaxID=853 RepID=UPI001BB32BA8